MQTQTAFDLHTEISKVAPIESVRLDDGNIEILFQKTATDEEKQAAQDIADNWDFDKIPPDWNAFLKGLASISGAYAKIAASSMSSIITTRISRLADGEQWLGADDPLIAAWNAAAPLFDEPQRTALSDLGTATGIPLAIDSDNLLSVSGD